MSSEHSPDNTPKAPTRPADHLETRQRAAARTTRLAATLVLIPAVPLLLLSVAALLLFYAAPTRLNSLLAQLPGDEFIRLALFFAPATLFAVVVLAVIYAREGLEDGSSGRPAAALAPVPAASTRPSGRKIQGDDGRRQWARRLLAPAAMLLLASLAIWLLSFVAPGRFSRLVDPLPGTSLIRLGVRFAPLALGLCLAGITWLALRAPAKVRSGVVAEPARPPRQTARAVVILLLLPAVPMLLLSLGALFSYYLTPESFREVLDHLGSEAFLRLVLLFAPAFLFAVIALAWLYLSAPGTGRALPEEARPQLASTKRESLAVVVLVVGLAATALIGSAVLGVLLYLLLR
jgi:hypothetical protein